ncbi:MAG: DUF2934 domain-containing protein [Sphingomicrobium sp.]
MTEEQEPPDKEQRIREEAFLLWNADGRPERMADQYWDRAKAVIAHQDELAANEQKRGHT